VTLIIGDNCSVNQSMANILDCKFVGCSAHRFALGVSDFLERHEQVINQVHILMIRLKTPKFSSLCRELGMKRPILRNKTRWSSTYAMMERYVQLSDSLDPRDPELADVLPDARQHRKIVELVEILKNLDHVTKILQTDSILLADIRTIFDKVISDYPGEQYEDLVKRLKIDADIIANPRFESAVAKVQDNNEQALTQEEKIELIPFLKEQVPEAEGEASTEIKGDNDISRVFQAVKKRRLTRASSSSNYQDLSFITGTSVECERFLSGAGYAYNSKRMRLDPVNLEMQMFLRYNKECWDEQTMYQVMRLHHSEKNRKFRATSGEGAEIVE
jgi:hypothetical protein